MPFTPNLGDFVSKSETHLNAQNNVAFHSTVILTPSSKLIISILQNVLAESGFKK
jgi:hypothetical protein